MTPNPPPHTLSAAAEPPPSSASSPPHLARYSRKRRFSPAGEIATSPSPTDLDHGGVHKNTRDLPNLSECHACGFRIGLRNGKHRLQALYSEWRIVLLCRNCLVLVESSRICSYCFRGASTDCFRCRGCKRSVHRGCFDEYRSIAPWSYSCSGSEFSLCVDCWVPKSMTGSSRASKSRRIGEKSDNARVSDEEDEVNKLEDAVKDAMCALERKVEVAKRARDKAEEKSSVATMAKGKASNAMDLAAKMGGDGAEVVGFVVSEIQLHREVNSSIRNAENLHSVSFSGLGVPRMLESDGHLSARVSDSGSPSVCGELEACTNKLNENPDKNISEHSICIRASSPGSLINMKCLNVDCMVDTTTSPKDDGACPGRCDAEDENASVDVSLFMNSFGNDICVSSASLPSQEQDRPTDSNAESCNCKYDRYLNKYSKKIKITNLPRDDNSVDRERDKSAEANAGNCNVESDRFLIKYRRRNKFMNSSGDENSMDREKYKSNEAIAGDCNFEPDHFLIKYSKRNKFMTSPGDDNSLNQEQDKSTDANAGDCNSESDRFLIKYRKRNKFMNSSGDDNSMDQEQGKSTQANAGDCNVEPDRFLIKYRKRNKFMHSSGDGNSMNCEQDRSNEANAGGCNFEPDRFLIKYSKRKKFMTSPGDDNSLNREQDKSTDANAGYCNFEPNHFLIKYRKRNKFMNSSGDDNDMDSESHLNPEYNKSTGANAANCSLRPDRFLIKYRKRAALKTIRPGSKTKFINKGFHQKSQTSSDGLLFNCSKESRTCTDSSFLQYTKKLKGHLSRKDHHGLKLKRSMLLGLHQREAHFEKENVRD